MFFTWAGKRKKTKHKTAIHMNDMELKRVEEVEKISVSKLFLLYLYSGLRKKGGIGMSDEKWAKWKRSPSSSGMKNARLYLLDAVASHAPAENIVSSNLRALKLNKNFTAMPELPANLYDILHLKSRRFSFPDLAGFVGEGGKFHAHISRVGDMCSSHIQSSFFWVQKVPSENRKFLCGS